MSASRSSADYAELKCKSNFSFLRGASDAREYIERASDLMIPAIGITDINGVYGLPRAFEECKDRKNVKLISGAELTLFDHPSITLLVRDRAAWGVLCRIITTSHAEKEKGKANLTKTELIEHLERPGASGLICMPDLTAHTDVKLLNDLFGDRLYLPLCRYMDGLDKTRELFVKGLAERFNRKIVATNNPHYHVPARSELQDVLTCIREGVPYREAGEVLFGNAERYLKSPLTMRSLFRDLKEALSNTMEIADSCQFTLSDLSYVYPKELTPEGETSQSYLETLVMEGAHKLYRGVISSKVDAQIQHELKIIRELGYASYFLTIFDIVRFARSQGIFCQGRGSAANSIVCFCLEVTAVDPVKHGLLFERFLSKERGEPPDIDIDFDNSRREEVIQYIYQKYGRDRAGMVAAVRTYRERSALLEVSKAVGVNVGTISAGELERNFEKYAGKDIDKLPKIQNLMEQIEDFPRHLSIHSGGFTLSHDPLIETVPIEPARMPGRTIIQWDKSDIDTVGLCKIDCLSLGFMNALGMLEKSTGLRCRDIPPNDEATYEMIRRADTDGTFQIESRAQKVMLVRTLPETAYDLVVEISLVRPGPGQGNMIKPYLIGRENARKGIKYKHCNAEMERILGRTHGVPIFQEQVMQMAVSLANFTPGEADQLRKCLSSFRTKEGVDGVAKKLYDGMIAKGVPKEECDKQFMYMKGYAHYGFPESHAVSFALLTYWSAYYKKHYPAHLFCALINSQPMGFYSVDYLVQSFKRNGVVILPIDINRSVWNAQMIDDRTVLMGFRDVLGLGEEVVNQLLAERKFGLFKSLIDFIQRSRLDKKIIRKLSLAGLFQKFGLDQRSTFWNAIEYEKLFDAGITYQMPLFSDMSTNEATQINYSFKPMDTLDQILADHSALGYSLKGNVMLGVRERLRVVYGSHLQLTYVLEQSSLTYLKTPVGKNITLIGLIIVIQKPPTANGTCFITFEDEYGTIDTILKPAIYEQFRSIIKENRFLIFKGQIKKNGTARLLVIQTMAAIEYLSHIHSKPSSPGEHPRNIGALNYES